MRDLIRAVKDIEATINELETITARLASSKATITQPTDNQLLTWDEQLSMIVNSLWQLPAADGAVNEIIYTDGAGNLGWIAPGVAAVAGADMEVQYNLAGAMGAEAAFTYNYNTNTLFVDNVSVSTATPLGTLDVSDGEQTLYIGADENAITRTDNVTKRSHIGMPQYDTDEPGMGIIAGHCTVAANSITIGTGGNEGLNAATQIILATAANTTALPATRFYIDNAGTAHSNYDIQIDSDAYGAIFGAGQDAEIRYNGTNFVFDSQLVGAGEFQFDNGDVGIATATPLGKLDVCDGTIGLIVGADDQLNTRTNLTSKYFRAGSPHYTNAEEPLTWFVGSSQLTQSALFIGGGSTFMNAFTNIRFHAAANTTTLNGTEMARITIDGVGINEISPDTLLHITDTSSSPVITLEGNCQSTILNYVVANREALILNAKDDYNSGGSIWLYGDADSTWPDTIRLFSGGAVSVLIDSDQTVKFTDTISPSASDGAALGTASLEFSDLYLADASVIYLGDDQDVTLTHVPDSGISLNLSLYTVSTTSSVTGVIYKGGNRFLHDFHHPTGGGAIPDGRNLFLGEDAGNFTTGSTATATSHSSYNLGVGYRALLSVTKGYNNLAIGSQALSNLTEANYCCAIGRDSLVTNTTGSSNIAIGYAGLYSNTTGEYNVAIGRSALYDCDDGSFNFGIGITALRELESGTANIAIGGRALYSIVDTDHNVGIGYQAGRYLVGGGNNTSGEDSVFLGSYTYPAGDGETNEVVIGYGADGLGSNTTAIGNVSTTITRLFGDVQIDSDSYGLVLGAGQDIKIHYNGTNLIVNPKVVGAGVVLLDTDSKVSFRDTAIGIYSQADTFLDMFADGSVRIGDSSAGAPTNYVNIESDGDMKFVGGAGLPFGSCYGNHIAWVQVNAVQNTWYNISDADMNDGNLHNVTHDGSGELTVTEPGMFFVSYSCCFENDAANDHVEIGIEINGSGAADAAGQCHVENKFASEEEHVGSSAILDLADNSTIEVAIRTTDAGTPTITVHAVNLSVIHIGGT